MSDNLAVLSRVIARLNAGVVLAAFLLLAHGINSSTECWGNEISVAGNGRPTGGSHEVGTSQIDRHVPPTKAVNGPRRLIGMFSVRTPATVLHSVTSNLTGRRTRGVNRGTRMCPPTKAQHAPKDL